MERMRLLAHVDTAPEGNVILDPLSGLFWLRIIPCGIRVGPITDPQVAIAGDALPMTGRVRVAGEKYSLLMESRGK
jgi:hypothetical protein